MGPITEAAIKELRKFAAKHEQADKQRDAAFEEMHNADNLISIILDVLSNDDLLRFGEEYPEFFPWVRNIGYNRWQEGKDPEDKLITGIQELAAKNVIEPGDIPF